MDDLIKVFISYSHDSDEHRDFVRQFSNRLRDEGLDSQIDQYINGSPPEGWQRWMEDKVEWADFVLLICTPLYLKRFKGKDTEGGRGVTFEGIIISQLLYDTHNFNTKFFPVIPIGGNIQDVPLALKGLAYLLESDYEKLYRVLTNQHASPAPPIGNINILSTIDYLEPENQKVKSPLPKMPTTSPPTIGKIVNFNGGKKTQKPEDSDTNKQYDLWLPFSIEVQNGKAQAEYIGDNSLSTPALPIEKLIQIESLFELLFGDTSQCLNFLQQLSETTQIETLESVNIRLRIMTNEPELAILPWQQMQCPSSGKQLIESGWMIEVGPQLRRYQEGFSEISFQAPIIVIPVDKENNVSSSQHYSLIYNYLISYLGINGNIPQITTVEQLQHELIRQQPDFIYIYCRIKNNTLQLDQSQISLDELAKLIEEAKISSPPCIIIKLIGSVNKTYPEQLIKHSRILWMQTRRKIGAHKYYEESLLKILDSLKHNTDLTELISTENKGQEQAYLWLNGRSPAVNSEPDLIKQQLRASLLRVMLGRTVIKNSMSNQISKTVHRETSNTLIYAIAGNKDACPLEFPAQLHHAIQWDDVERGLNVLPLNLYLSINLDLDNDLYDEIESILDKELLHGYSDFEAVFQRQRQSRGLDYQDCCIMLNWLVTVPSKKLDILTPLIENWIKEWCLVLQSNIVGKIPERTVLVNSACLELEGNHEDLPQTIHDIANRSIRNTNIQQLLLIRNKEALGKIDETEIEDFFQDNQRWREELKLESKGIDPRAYSDWLIKNQKGLFEPTVNLIWQQYLTNYQDYLQQNTPSS